MDSEGSSAAILNSYRDHDSYYQQRMKLQLERLQTHKTELERPEEKDSNQDEVATVSYREEEIARSVGFKKVESNVQNLEVGPQMLLPEVLKSQNVLYILAQTKPYICASTIGYFEQGIQV